MENVNEDKFNPIDGKALKYCDKLSAYIEAGISISYGVKSKELTDGFNNMYKFFSEKPKIDGVDFLEICDDFNEHFGLERPPLRWLRHTLNTSALLCSHPEAVLIKSIAQV